MSVVAIDLGGTNCRTAVVGAGGEITARDSRPTPVAQGADAVTEMLVEAVEAYRTDNPDITAVGVGFPGFLLAEGRVLQSPNLPGFEDLPLQQHLSERLADLRVVVNNDADAAALGEKKFGCAQQLEDFVQITLGTGLGSGFILAGRLYHGSQGMAGELGHIPITFGEDAFDCPCGRRGCLETVVSKTGFNNWVRAAGRDAIELHEAAELATQGDAFFLEVFAKMGRWLGIGLASVANMLDLEAAVIGGGIANAWDLFIDPTRTELKERSVQHTTMRVLRSELADDAGLLGAASLVL